jgi:methylmalonyl-CoA mutase
LKGKVKSIVLAGYPKEQVEAYKAQGVDEFIHVKTNVLESLTAFQKMLNLI